LLLQHFSGLPIGHGLIAVVIRQGRACNQKGCQSHGQNLFHGGSPVWFRTTLLRQADNNLNAI